jgi:magnesium transporter
MAPLEARLYEEGSDQVAKVQLDSVKVPVEDRSLLWVDASSDETALAQLERIGSQDAARELVDARDRDIAFHGESVRLSVFGLSAATDELAPTRLALLLARNIVITIHDEPIRGLADPVRVMAHDPRFGRLDAGHFAGLLLEGMLAGYDEVIEDLWRAIDDLDERALQREPSEDLLEAMVELRRHIASLRRALAPQRAVFVALITPVEDDPPPVGIPDAALLAHLERTVDSVERLRDQLIGSFDILMTRTGQRTNDIVRVLTVVSAVLLPAVVVAGIMGMNFKPGFFDRPELFFVVVAVMIALAVGTLTFARLRRWI